MNLVTECECIREWVQVTFIALSHRGVRSKKSTGDGHNADESLTYSLLLMVSSCISWDGGIRSKDLPNLSNYAIFLYLITG